MNFRKIDYLVVTEILGWKVINCDASMINNEPISEVELNIEIEMEGEK